MANSKTEHSKKLRQETSKEFNKVNYRQLKDYYNIHCDRDMELYNILKSMGKGKQKKEILYKLLIG